MNMKFDTRQVRRAFSRAADGYAAAALLQNRIEAQLLESLDYLDERLPNTILDLGCGLGSAATNMQARWPNARVLAGDLALPMLRQAALQSWQQAGIHPLPLCCDARALPLADSCVDVLFSNLCLQWVDDLAAVCAEFRRVLKPDGLLLCSTFGPGTLHELRVAFAQADAAPHISPFASIAQLGDLLLQSGFRDPVLDRDSIVNKHSDMQALMRQLRALGATNALTTRRRTLTGRARFRAAAAAYEIERGEDGLLPATWEVITAMAWAPAVGMPIHLGDVDEVRVPVSAIPIRRQY